MLPAIMQTVITRRPFSVEEYYRMAEAGVLAEDERVELIEGEIIAMSPIGNRHMVCVNRLNWMFSGLVGGAAIVSVQNPIRLDHYSAPQPDIALLKFRDDFYSQLPPAPSDLLLVVEVSDTTLDYDRRIKIPLYATAGIPEAWVVDLHNGNIEVYTLPVGNMYSRIRIVQRGEQFELTGIEGTTIMADSVLE
jgi:Uma2 family endonuclease